MTDTLIRPAPDETRRGGVDPRFRARRIAVRKQAGRRRLKRLLVLIAVAVVSLAAVIVLRSPILDVDAVVVRGAASTDVDAVLVEVDVGIGEPLLLVDLGRIESAVGALPWVASVEAERELPGQLVIRITEREPLAVVNGGGRAMVVDGAGHVLEPAPAAALPPYVHVLVSGAPPDPGGVIDDALLGAVDLAGRLRSNPSGVVSAVVLEPRLHLRLVAGGIVELGDFDDLDDKLEAFRTVNARVDQTCLDVLDLRVPTHPVLTRVDGC